MSKTVFLNAGHGGSDPGAVGNDLKEKELNLNITLACCDELKRHDVDVVMGRTKDVDAHSSDIIKKCNSSGAELAVDIHNNAGGGDGVEVFYTIGGGTGKTLASNILNEIVAIGQNSRGIKTKKGSSGKDYYYFIRETAMPAVIVECAFIDNKTDIKIIDTAAEQKKMGVAIAKGVLKTLGIIYKTQSSDSSITVDDKKSDAQKITVSMQKISKDNGFNRKGQVLTLQRLLNELKEGKGYPGKDGKKLTLDGDFGTNTDYAIRSYQKARNLTVDGICGKESWSSLLCEYD